MHKYSCFCTKDQIKKALELGAPINYASIGNLYLPHKEIEFISESGEIKYGIYAIPTTEEMINWLEEQDDIEEITILRNRAFHSWAYLITNKHNKLVSSNNIYYSRGKANLAAIDAALEYLINKKK